MAELSAISAEAMNVIKNTVKKQPLSVIGISKEDKNWEALVEVLERRAVPDTQNLIGIYRVVLSDAAKVLSYKRVEVRRKADVGVEGPAEEKAE